jgi:hypothetical protein
MIHLYVLPLVAFDLIAGGFDMYETVRGLKAGVALEANGVINALAKVMPVSSAVLTYNLGKTVGLAALSLIPNPVCIGGSIGGLITSGAGHIQGGVKWRYLNNGGKIDRTKKYSWWQKLLGIGWN